MTTGAIYNICTSDNIDVKKKNGAAGILKSKVSDLFRYYRFTLAQRSRNRWRGRSLSSDKKAEEGIIAQ